MKKIIALFFTGLLSVTTTFAQTIACGVNIDNSREFRVIFVNGIDNTIEDACSSSQAIINMIGNTSKFSFSYFYNSKDASGADQQELSWQSRMSNTALAAFGYKQSDIFNNNAKKLNYYSLLGGLYSSAIAENISAPGSVLTTTRRLRDLLSEQLKNSLNRKLLLVAHSQGNFYVEAAYAMLYSEALKKSEVEVNDLIKRVRVVGVASVAASTPNNKYLSHSKDVAVFLGQEAVSRLSQSNYAPLPPNEDACIFSPCNDSSGITEGALYYVAILPGGGNDKALHNFQAVYLNTSIYSLENGKSFPLIISGMMATAVLELSQANCGTVISPAIAGQQGPTYTVIASQPTRFITTPVPNNGYPFGTYRWKTSEGAEILSTIEQANVTFTTAGSGSVTVTPILADGTVCAGSAATSSVTVKSLATTVFQDDFNGTALDLKKWEIQYLRGQPAVYSVSGGLLRLANPGGSRGAAGETDGNLFIPNVSAVSGDFQVTIAVQEIARTQAGSYKDSSGFRLQFGNTNISLFGNYNGYWFNGPYNSYKGHRFQASDPNGNLCLLDDSLDLNTMYSAELRIRRSFGVGYVGYRLAGKTAWTEKPCALMASAVPNFVIASGDGGGTSQNGSFTGNVDRFEISTDPVLSTVNGHRYEVISCATWTACRDAAVAKGGKLVTIRSQAEKEWIVSTFGPTRKKDFGFWIGLTDDGSEGNFRWVSGEPVTYTYWLNYQPSNSFGGENFVHLWWYGQRYGVIDPNEVGFNDTTNTGSGADISQAIVEYSN